MDKKILENIKKNILPITIIAAAIIIAGSYIYISKTDGAAGIPASQVLSAQDAANKAIGFINSMGQGAATLKNTVKENGLYKVSFSLGAQDYDAYVTLNAKLIFPDAIEIVDKTPVVETVGGFIVTTDAVCQEDNKPIVYFFGSATCPHCIWEKPVVEKVMKKFEGLLSFHENIDSAADQDVFSKYNSEGGIPTIVAGCNYYRIGSGESSGEETETNNLTAIFCKLSGNKPEAVCKSVQDLIDQIK